MTAPNAEVKTPTSGLRLSEAVEAANTLLYHAISTGEDLPSTVRDPIVKARAALDRGLTMNEDEEGRFLDAYAKLALNASPVSAATLDATSRGRERRGWLGKFLRLRPISDAQRLVSWFGLLMICLIAAIALGEATCSFIRSISAAERQFAVNSQALRETETRRGSIEKQLALLEPAAGTTTDTPNNGALRESLRARMDEVEAKIWSLDYTNRELDKTIKKGYEVLGREKLQYISVPLSNILGSFLLPLFYGALGTCAFVLRSLYREMVDRTFDGRRTGEFIVRILLGMLSGITLQWLVVRSDGTVAGGVTPAVLAFLGGYSVEMLFTAIDRLVNLVAGRGRPSHRGQSAAPRPRREPPEPPEGKSVGSTRSHTSNGANGAALGPRTARPVAPVAHLGRKTG